MSDISKKLQALISNIRNPETAAETFQLDIKEMDMDEVALYATLSRLHRLVDVRAEEIINDHIANMRTTSQADRMVDICTEDYMLALDISYRMLSKMAMELTNQARKFGIQTPEHWAMMSTGQFDFYRELDRFE